MKQKLTTRQQYELAYSTYRWQARENQNTPMPIRNLINVSIWDRALQSYDQNHSNIYSGFGDVATQETARRVRLSGLHEWRARYAMIQEYTASEGHTIIFPSTDNPETEYKIINTGNSWAVVVAMMASGTERQIARFARAGQVASWMTENGVF